MSVFTENADGNIHFNSLQLHHIDSDSVKTCSPSDHHANTVRCLLPLGFTRASDNLQIDQVIKCIYLSNAVTGQRLDPSQKSLQASRTISADPWVRS